MSDVQSDARSDAAPSPCDTPPRRRKRRILGAVLVALAALVALANWTWGSLPDEPPRSGSEAQLGDMRVRYVEHPGDGTAIVLIHGLPGTAEDFEKVTPLLAGHRTIALDRPGYGYSDGGRRIAAELPHARYVPVPGGHMVPLVHPDVVAKAAAHLRPAA